MFKTLISAIFCCTLVGFAHAEQIKVGITEWVGYTNADGTGKYHDVINQVFAGDELAYTYGTYQRKVHFFERGDFDVVVGVFLEDIKTGIVPYWYLDYEYPLLAFVDKNSDKIKSAEDLNGAMISWLRGYKFSKFIDVPHQSYIVSQERNGFELLLKGRTDAFIDYEYNLYDEYKDRVKSFEILPAKKMYVVFKDSEKGKRLAAKFDKGMKALRDTGVLEAIYKEEYPRTLFAEVDDTKPKMEIRTRDIDLLKGESSLLESSLESSLFSNLFSQLIGYEFDLVKYTSFSDDVEDFGHSENTCLANKAKIEERERHFLFSEPVAMYPGLRLYATEPLPLDKVSGGINIKALFEQFPRLTIGVPEGQFFSEQINKELANLGVHQKIAASTDIMTQLEALAKQRYDLKIEFPVVMDNRWHYVSDKPIYSYALADANPYTLGYLMCSKSQKNERFLADFNRTLALWKTQEMFKKYHRQSAKSLSEKEFNKLFNQAFSD